MDDTTQTADSSAPVDTPAPADTPAEAPAAPVADAPAEAPAPEPAADVVTIKLKQNAYWQGEFHTEGSTFTYARDEAQQYLTKTDLFVAA